MSRRLRKRKLFISVGRCWCSTTRTTDFSRRRRRPYFSWRRRRPTSWCLRRHRRHSAFSFCLFPTTCQSQPITIRRPTWRSRRRTSSTTTSTIQSSSTTQQTLSLSPIPAGNRRRLRRLRLLHLNPLHSWANRRPHPQRQQHLPRRQQLLPVRTPRLNHLLCRQPQRSQWEQPPGLRFWRLHFLPRLPGRRR